MTRRWRAKSALEGSWYAAPAPNADADFVDKYRATFGAAPAQLASAGL